MGFTCNCCGARNYSRVNPRAFQEGTMAAQCKKCEVWHKITDHLKLFHQVGPGQGGQRWAGGKEGMLLVARLFKIPAPAPVVLCLLGSGRLKKKCVNTILYYLL